MLTIFPGGMAGRIGTIVWCCGADVHADNIFNVLRTGYHRFGTCQTRTPEQMPGFIRWMTWLCR